MFKPMELTLEDISMQMPMMSVWSIAEDNISHPMVPVLKLQEILPTAKLHIDQDNMLTQVNISRWKEQEDT